MKFGKLSSWIFFRFESSIESGEIQKRNFFFEASISFIYIKTFFFHKFMTLFLLKFSILVISPPTE